MARVGTAFTAVGSAVSCSSRSRVSTPRDFGPLPKTLFCEDRPLAALAEYFVAHHGAVAPPEPKAAAIPGRSSSPPPPTPPAFPLR